MVRAISPLTSMGRLHLRAGVTSDRKTRSTVLALQTRIFSYATWRSIPPRKKHTTRRDKPRITLKCARVDVGMSVWGGTRRA